MPELSPWGQVFERTPLAPGVSRVGCPGHGGILVGIRVADRELSDFLWGVAVPWGNLLTFEEEVDAFCLLSEHPAWARSLLEMRLGYWLRARPVGAQRESHIEQIRDQLREQIRWTDDQLREHYRQDPADVRGAYSEAELVERGRARRAAYRESRHLEVGDRVWLKPNYTVRGPFRITRLRPLRGETDGGQVYQIPRRGIAFKERD